MRSGDLRHHARDSDSVEGEVAFSPGSEDSSPLPTRPPARGEGDQSARTPEAWVIKATRRLQMYVNFFDRFQRAQHEANTIGIVLCSEKNEAMVKITLPRDNEHILAASYQMYLPTEEELRAELAREREAAERALRNMSEKDPRDGKD